MAAPNAIVRDVRQPPIAAADGGHAVRRDSAMKDKRGIDRLSPEPYYLQLGRIVEEAIDKGEYTLGQRLPAESELCRRYDLARSTVRETLRALVKSQRTYTSRLPGVPLLSVSTMYDAPLPDAGSVPPDAVQTMSLS